MRLNMHDSLLLMISDMIFFFIDSNKLNNI